MKNVILIGFMGAGKTTIGTDLAEKTGCLFIDTDTWIEQAEGKSIPQIFEANGEPYFRECETRCLRTLLKENTKDCIIATGGGIISNEINQELLQQLGQVFYLEIDDEQISIRLAGSNNRPLIQNDSKLSKAIMLLQNRRPIYEKCADHIINTSNISITECTNQIRLLLEEG